MSARALAAAPQPSPTPLTTLEAGASSQGLSNRRGSWQSAYLSYERRLLPRKVLYATLIGDRRFGSGDQTYVAGFYLPPSVNTILNVELAYSPTHVNLPRERIGVSLDHRLDDGWGYSIGVQNRTYSAFSVQMGSFLVDRYWKSFRWAYTLTESRLSNVAGMSLSQAALLTHYYGADGASSLTIGLNAGREAENVGNGLVVVSAVTGARLGGIHWLDKRWGFIWSLSTVRQGSLYTRSGVQLGVRARL